MGVAGCRYVGVGESEEVQLFYYFVESQRSPSQDPLMLYIAGGPGCSSLSSLLYENGTTFSFFSCLPISNIFFHFPKVWDLDQTQKGS